MDISFVIPCYCSSETLQPVVAEIKNVVADMDISDFEIILVNDCSPDGAATWKKIRQLCADDHRIRGVNLAKNGGQAAATMAGMAMATGELVIVGDDDGQTPFESVPEMTRLVCNEDFDIVCANYTSRGRRSLIRNFGSWVNLKMTYYTLEIPSDLMVSVFFVAKQFVVREMLKYTNPYPYILGLMTQTTHNIGNVDVEQRGRLSGKSGYTFTKLLSMWMNGLTAFSVKPLRIASFLGFAFAVSGFFFGAFIVLRKILHPDIMAGYSSILSALMVIGGIIMLMLGLIGEYVGRVYICLNDRPQYVIKEKLNLGEESQITL